MSRKALMPLLITAGWLSLTSCLLSADFLVDVQATMTEAPATELLKSTYTATLESNNTTATSTSEPTATPSAIDTLDTPETSVPAKTAIPAQNTPETLPLSSTATQLPPASVPPATDTIPASDVAVHEFTADILALVNQARCANGITPLVLNSQLSEAALRHSMDMAQHDFVSHTGSDNSNGADRVNATGYNWVMVAENIAAGMQAPQEAFNLWMDSPAHRDNIMHSDLREMGLAVVSRPGTEYGWYWTQVFGSQGQLSISCADAGY